MIPGPFSYHRPATLADAVNLLSTLGDEARPLAGGHSLVPMMKLRLASPEHLIDLHGIAGLKGIRRDGDTIVIGAMTTQHELLASDDIGKSLPILHETALLIADPQVRYRGTIGGNVANGDPGNDMPALMMTLGASYRLEGKSGAREVAATEFYQGAYFTALEPGEILTAISIPVPAAGHGYAYEKLKRKVGDYATAAAAVVLTMAGGKVATCAIGLTNLSETPLLAEDAAKAVIGTSLDPATLKKAAAAAVAIMSPAADARGPVEYRKHVGGIMVTRALTARRQPRQLRGETKMAKTHVTMKVNGAEVEGLVEPRTLLVHFIRENLLAHRHPYRLRDHPLRRLHRRYRRHVGEVLHHVRGAGPGFRDHDHRGRRQCRRLAVGAAGRLSHDARAAMRLLHARHDLARAAAAARKIRRRREEEIRMGISGNLCRCTGYQNIVKAIQYAAAKINGVEFQEAAE